LFSVGNADSDTDYFHFDTGDRLVVVLRSSSTTSTEVASNAFFRDPSAWYHMVMRVDSTQGTDSDRVRIYANGSQITSLQASTYPSQNTDFETNDTNRTQVGARSRSSVEHFHDGYMADVYFIDGTSLGPDSFGKTDGPSGIWKPKAASVTFGTNGFFLEFKETGITHTITAAGNVHHETDQKKFGGSSIHFDGTGDYLSIPASNDFHFGTGSYTIEMWVYNTVSAYSFLLYNATGDMNSTGVRLALTADGYVQMNEQVANGDVAITGDVDVADGAWHHIAVCRDADDDGEMEIYVDGTLDEKLDGNANRNFNTIGNVWYIGSRAAGSSPYTGYIDELRISNSARYTSNFTPSASAFSDDDNTVLLLHSDTSDGSTTFVDSSGLKKGVGADTSGNGNDFTETNLESKDQCTDTPTNNFATLNPLSNSSQASYSEGNLDEACNDNYGVGATQAFANGKWYWEVKIKAGDNNLVGIANSDEQSRFTTTFGINNYSLTVYGVNGKIYREGSEVEDVSDTYGANDIVGVAVDMDSGTRTVQFYKNGSTFGSATTLPTGWGFTLPMIRKGGSSQTSSFNFGNPAFAISSGNADANGYGNFEYAPPSGYYALCTKNLAEFG
jgi:hypothetical protein